MANNSKKYISLNRLSNFLDNLKNMFASLNHTHKVSDLTDYAVDTELSSTSTNPIANSVVSDEFEAIGESFDAVTGVLETMSDALDALGNHNHDDIYYTEIEIDERLNNVINEVKTDSSNKDVVVLSEAQKGISNALASAKEYTDVIASGKADASHNHNDIYYTQAQIDAALSHKSQVQIITWEADD